MSGHPENKEVCHFWPNCKKRDNCGFYHPDDKKPFVATRLCKFGSDCTFGNRCTFYHPPEGNQSVVGTRLCLAWPDCTFGNRCTFYHPPGSVLGPESRPSKRCVEWPNCQEISNCPFIHPMGPCKKYPLCSNGSQCPNLHPVCHIDKCISAECKKMHLTEKKFTVNGKLVSWVFGSCNKIGDYDRVFFVADSRYKGIENGSKFYDKLTPFYLFVDELKVSEVQGIIQSSLSKLPLAEQSNILVICAVGIYDMLKGFEVQCDKKDIQMFKPRDGETHEIVDDIVSEMKYFKKLINLASINKCDIIYTDLFPFHLIEQELNIEYLHSYHCKCRLRKSWQNVNCDVFKFMEMCHLVNERLQRMNLLEPSLMFHGNIPHIFDLGKVKEKMVFITENGYNFNSSYVVDMGVKIKDYLNSMQSKEIMTKKVIIIGDYWLEPIARGWPTSCNIEVKFEIDEQLNLITLVEYLLKKYRSLEDYLLLISFTKGDVFNFTEMKSCMLHKPAIKLPEIRPMLVSNSFFQDNFSTVMKQITDSLYSKLNVSMIGFVNFYLYDMKYYQNHLVEMHAKQTGHVIKLDPNMLQRSQRDMEFITAAFNNWIAKFNKDNHLPIFDTDSIIHYKIRLKKDIKGILEDGLHVTRDIGQEIAEFYCQTISKYFNKNDKTKTSQLLDNQFLSNKSSFSLDVPDKSNLRKILENAYQKEQESNEPRSDLFKISKAYRRSRSRSSSSSRSSDRNKKYRSKSPSNTRWLKHSRSRSRSRSKRYRHRSRSRSLSQRRKYARSPSIEAERDTNYGIDKQSVLDNIKTKFDATYENYKNNPDSHPEYHKMRDDFFQQYYGMFNTANGPSLSVLTAKWKQSWDSVVDNMKEEAWQKKLKQCLPLLKDIKGHKQQSSSHQNSNQVERLTNDDILELFKVLLSMKNIIKEPILTLEIEEFNAYLCEHSSFRDLNTVIDAHFRDILQRILKSLNGFINSNGSPIQIALVTGLVTKLDKLYKSVQYNDSIENSNPKSISLICNDKDNTIAFNTDAMSKIKELVHETKPSLSSLLQESEFSHHSQPSHNTTSNGNFNLSSFESRTNNLFSHIQEPTANFYSDTYTQNKPDELSHSYGHSSHTKQGLSQFMQDVNLDTVGTNLQGSLNKPENYLISYPSKDAYNFQLQQSSNQQNALGNFSNYDDRHGFAPITRHNSKEIPVLNTDRQQSRKRNKSAQLNTNTISLTNQNKEEKPKKSIHDRLGPMKTKKSRKRQRKCHRGFIREDSDDTDEDDQNSSGSYNAVPPPNFDP